MTRRKEKVRLPLHDFFTSKSRTSSIQEIRIRDDVKGRRASVAESSEWAASQVTQDRHDVENKCFVIEAKQTVKNRYSVTHRVLIKVDKEASNRKKTPALVVEFKGMCAGIERSWTMVPLAFFETLKLSCYIVERATDKKSFPLTESILAMIDKDAVTTGRIPVLKVTYVTMRFGVPDKWAVIPYPVFVKIAREG